MQGSDSFLLELLSASRRRFIIPVYQRNYDWKKANCEHKMAILKNLFRLYQFDEDDLSFALQPLKSEDE